MTPLLVSYLIFPVNVFLRTPEHDPWRSPWSRCRHYVQVQPPSHLMLHRSPQSSKAVRRYHSLQAINVECHSYPARLKLIVHIYLSFCKTCCFSKGNDRLAHRLHLVTLRLTRRPPSLPRLSGNERPPAINFFWSFIFLSWNQESRTCSRFNSLRTKTPAPRGPLQTEQ